MLYLRTLAIVIVVSAVVFSFATVVVRRILPEERSLRYWTTGSVFITVSALLLGLRGIVPEFFSIVLANSGMVLGIGFIHVGSHHLFKQGPVRAWHWLAGAAAFFLFLVFTYGSPSLPARIATVSLLMAPFFAACGWLFLRSQDRQLRAVNLLTGLIFMVGAVMFFLRGATASVNLVTTDYASTASWIVAAPYFYAILFNVWMSIMLTLKLSDRLQQQLAQALIDAETVNRELVESLDFNETILLKSPLPMGVYAKTGKCVLANDAYAKLIGTTCEDLLMQNFNSIDSWKKSGLLADCLSALAHRPVEPSEMHVASSFGKDVMVEYRILLTHLKGQPHLLIQFLDLTDRMHLEQALRKMAFHDVLTDLPNRRLFVDRLEHALEHSRRNNTYVAILFLDLNRFKELNDVHGHGVGDKMLIEVANRLRHCVRDMDTVARFGGDEFIILFEGLSAKLDVATESAARMTEKIQNVLDGEYTLGHVRHHGSVSIGIKLCHGKNNSLDQIINDADLAMYQTKKAARDVAAALKAD